MTTYRKLGRSGLHLFPTGLGSMQLGSERGREGRF